MRPEMHIVAFEQSCAVLTVEYGAHRIEWSLYEYPGEGNRWVGTLGDAALTVDRHEVNADDCARLVAQMEAERCDRCDRCDREDDSGTHVAGRCQPCWDEVRGAA